MSLEFNFSISVTKKTDVETIKDFAKQYFSFICESESNIDHHSEGNVIRGESMAVSISDDTERSRLFYDSLGCDFAKALAEVGIDIKKFTVYYEELFAGIGSIKKGNLSYEARQCEENAEFNEETMEVIVAPDYKVTGTKGTGFVTEEIPFTEGEYDRLCEELD